MSFLSRNCHITFVVLSHSGCILATLTRNHFIIHCEMISDAIRQDSAAAKPPERAENHAFRRSDSSYIALWRCMK